MVENRPFVTFLSHVVLILGVLVIGFPLWMTFVASTHDQATMLRAPVPLLPGPHLIDNYAQVLIEGFGRGFGGAPIWLTLLNSLIMALGVALGKITISIISAFAIVYFRFPLRMAFFWAIFITMGAEQFGTNLRATAATTIPNMVRGALPLINLLFLNVFQKDLHWPLIKSGIVTGIVTMAIAIVAFYFTEETFQKDLNYVEVD